jgi:hypothetical protein
MRFWLKQNSLEFASRSSSSRLLRGFARFSEVVAAGGCNKVVSRLLEVVSRLL